MDVDVLVNSYHVRCALVDLPWTLFRWQLLYPGGAAESGDGLYQLHRRGRYIHPISDRDIYLHNYRQVYAKSFTRRNLRACI